MSVSLPDLYGRGFPKIHLSVNYLLYSVDIVQWDHSRGKSLSPSLFLNVQDVFLQIQVLLPCHPIDRSLHLMTVFHRSPAYKKADRILESHLFPCLKILCNTHLSVNLLDCKVLSLYLPFLSNHKCQALRFFLPELLQMLFLPRHSNPVSALLY